MSRVKNHNRRKIESSLKIAMFGHKWIPSRIGGVEVVVDELATRMVALGHKVTCYNRSGNHIGEEELKKRNTYKNITLKNVWTINIKGLAALTASLSAAICTAFGKYDIVHIHAEGPAFMCWLPKLLGKRVIVTIHGLDWARAKWGKLASWCIKNGEKSAVKHADEIIVLSRGIQDYFFTKYNRKTVFIPNGVIKNEKKDAEEIKRQFGLEKDGYVLFLGRLVPEKGVHYLIESWKSLNTDKKLVIAGRSSDTQGYVDKIKRMAGENVLFVGFQQGRIIEELYSNSYIYCLPSDLEGMPITLLEAMSYGNCCLVSDIPECAEVVEDKALTFKKGSVKNLRDKLQELIDDPNRVEWYKSRSSNFICSKYNWEDVVNQTLKLYEGEKTF